MVAGDVRFGLAGAGRALMARVAGATSSGGAPVVVVVGAAVVDVGGGMVGCGRGARFDAGRGGGVVVAGGGGFGGWASGAGAGTWARVPMRITGLCAGSSQLRTASSAEGATATQPAVAPDDVESCRKMALPLPITVGLVLKSM